MKYYQRFPYVIYFDYPSFFGAIVYLGFMVRRAMFKVINIFCQHDAVGVQNTKTIDEFGLKPLDFFQRFWRLRYYKPYALQILTEQGIVGITEDGKLYMLEEDKLNENLTSRRIYWPIKCQSSSYS